MNSIAYYLKLYNIPPKNLNVNSVLNSFNLHISLLLQVQSRALRIRPEFRLHVLQLKHDLLMSRPWRQLEEPIHRLEGDAFCFWDQEPHEDDGAEHQGREEEIDTIGHFVEHLGGETRDWHGIVSFQLRGWKMLYISLGEGDNRKRMQ